MSTLNSTQKSQVKRGRPRANYDMEKAKAIIDDSLLCHVAQSIEGQPFVTPTCHWREGNRLYWHGHVKARNLGEQGAPVCINISQLDGLVMARSAFHHSVNYRSVSLFGRVNLVTDEQEKLRQLEKFINKISPDRWDKLRPITAKELMITGIAWIEIDEGSIKYRAEGVNDDEADLDWPVWAGVLPIQPQFCTPVTEYNASQFDFPQQPNVFTGVTYK